MIALIPTQYAAEYFMIGSATGEITISKLLKQDALKPANYIVRDMQTDLTQYLYLVSDVCILMHIKSTNWWYYF